MKFIAETFFLTDYFMRLVLVRFFYLSFGIAMQPTHKILNIIP